MFLNVQVEHVPCSSATTTYVCYVCDYELDTNYCTNLNFNGAGTPTDDNCACCTVSSDRRWTYDRIDYFEKSNRNTVDCDRGCKPILSADVIQLNWLYFQPPFSASFILSSSYFTFSFALFLCDWFSSHCYLHCIAAFPSFPSLLISPSHFLHRFLSDCFYLGERIKGRKRTRKIMDGKTEREYNKGRNAEWSNNGINEGS